jgi:hypothetical protein
MLLVISNKIDPKLKGICSNEQSANQQSNYRTKCRFFRQGGIVKNLETGEVVFMETRKVLKNKKIEEVVNVNAAKRFIRKFGGKSYTVK